MVDSFRWVTFVETITGACGTFSILSLRLQDVFSILGGRGSVLRFMPSWMTLFVDDWTGMGRSLYSFAGCCAHARVRLFMFHWFWLPSLIGWWVGS